MNLNAQAKDRGIALKTEVNSPDSIPYSVEEITMLTHNFRKLFQNSGKTSRNQNFMRSESRDKMNDNAWKKLKNVLKGNALNQNREREVFNAGNVNSLAIYKLSV